MTHQYQATPTRIVDFEVWFSFGSDNTDISGNRMAVPNNNFQIDSQVSGSTPTSIATGNRTYFIATWQQANWAGSSFSYLGEWFFDGQNKTYGDVGYVTPWQNYNASGYYTDFPANQNKRNVQYVKLSVNTTTGAWISLQANHMILDLTNCPALGGPMYGVKSPGDPANDLIDFNGGLNGLVQITNTSHSSTTASFAELHRTRMTYR